MKTHLIEKELKKYQREIDRYAHRMQMLTRQQNSYVIMRDRLVLQLAEARKANETIPANS